jgi:hypothetical protein
MKTLQVKKMGKFFLSNFLMSRKIIIAILFPLILSGFQATAQLPVVTVRFFNPQYDCKTQAYCVDVEFHSNQPYQQLFGINVRFFYDDNVLEYLSMGDFRPGYGPVSPYPPIITTLNPGSGAALFGFVGPAEYLNGAVQMVSTPPEPLYISTTGWTKIFNVCFHVDDPNALNNSNFCPSVVWDLAANPENGGFLGGGQGVVISVVAPPPDESAEAIANVFQFNWQYDGTPETPPYGIPVNTTCLSTQCFEMGDAPEAALAYPDLGVMGNFPTCINVTTAGYITHFISDLWFGPSHDYDLEGNGGLCSSFNPYDNDELALDGDAGLLLPSAFTINLVGQYVSITPPPSVSFGEACDTSYWGINAAYVNVLADWSQDGTWTYDPLCTCYGSRVPEHILVNQPVPNGFDGPVSALIPPGTGYRMGPKDGYVWVRFSVTDVPVPRNWIGEGEFMAGETEDYLLYVDPPDQIPLANWSVILTIILIAGATLFIWRRRIS